MYMYTRDTTVRDRPTDVSVNVAEHFTLCRTLPHENNICPWLQLGYRVIMWHSLGVSWIALAEINGFAPSEDSRKHINSVWVSTAR